MRKPICRRFYARSTIVTIRFTRFTKHHPGHHDSHAACRTLLVSHCYEFLRTYWDRAANAYRRVVHIWNAHYAHSVIFAMPLRPSNRRPDAAAAAEEYY